jgi:hypothetical protein
MVRILWIVGLSLSVLVFGGMTVLTVVALITHRHLNERGWVTLSTSGFITWITIEYLRLKIRGPRDDASSSG